MACKQAGAVINADFCAYRSNLDLIGLTELSPKDAWSGDLTHVADGMLCLNLCKEGWQEREDNLELDKTLYYSLKWAHFLDLAKYADVIYTGFCTVAEEFHLEVSSI